MKHDDKINTYESTTAFEDQNVTNVVTFTTFLSLGLPCLSPPEVTTLWILYIVTPPFISYSFIKEV